MSETADVSTRMKNRWIGVLALATVLSLGACAPTQQGADESAAVTAEPPSTADGTPSAAPAGSSAPDDYDY